MKKLLALVLCVMLFISVIPTFAFADEAAASGISLWPVVEQANQYYDSLRGYDGLSKVAGLANGFVKSYPDAAASEKGVAALNALKDVWNEIKRDPNLGASHIADAIGAVHGAIGEYIIGKSAAELEQARENAITGSKNAAQMIWDGVGAITPPGSGNTSGSQNEP